MLDQCDRKFTVGWVDDLGNDSLISGAGEDLFVLGSATEVDAITDFQVDPDRLGLSGGLRFEQLAIARGTGISARDTFVRIAANQELLTILSNVPASSITAAAFTFVGTSIALTETKLGLLIPFMTAKTDFTPQSCSLKTRPIWRARISLDRQSPLDLTLSTLIARAQHSWVFYSHYT
jgi:hypothetical protein